MQPVWDEGTVISEKIDGSLSLLYFYRDEWLINTRGSFASGELNFTGKSWGEWIWQTIPNVQVVKALDPRYTYVMEFVSPHNKVVRLYPKPQLYLLTVVETTTGLELPEMAADEIANLLGIARPQRFDFADLAKVTTFIFENSKNDPTFEGVVICDRERRRAKLKSDTYFALHRLKGEGDNLFNPKHLLPFILAGEESELLTYYPECKEKFYDCKSKVLEALVDVVCVWADNWKIETQKDFALKIKDTAFASVLFEMRKRYGDQQSSKLLKDLWRESEPIILKRLFKG